MALTTRHPGPAIVAHDETPKENHTTLRHVARRRVQAVRGAVAARIPAVPSKSATHRALVAAALARGESRILRPLVADDTRITAAGLRQLGVTIDDANRDVWIVRGAGPRLAGGGELSLGDSGTSLRFLLAAAALGSIPAQLDGSARLRERPVGELARALGDLGASVRCTAGGGGLPAFAGGRFPEGGAVRIAGSPSSQFASALLLIGAALPRGLDLRVDPPVVSRPYVELTVEVLAAFGPRVEQVEPNRWRVQRTEYPGVELEIEGDASSASYFLALPAIVGGRVRVDGLRPRSVQPDARLGAILASLGCTVRTGEAWVEVEGRGETPGFELEIGDAPDLVPTLAAIALFASGPTTLRGVSHLRVKESDRLELLARNLTALGRPARALQDRLEIGAPAGALRGARIETRSDHRMAMAFAVAGLKLPGVEIDDADCVAKSNPDFWELLERVVAGTGDAGP